MVNTVAVAADDDGVTSIRFVFHMKSKDLLLFFKRFIEAPALNCKLGLSPVNTTPFCTSSLPDTSKSLYTVMDSCCFLVSKLFMTLARRAVSVSTNGLKLVVSAPSSSIVYMYTPLTLKVF